MIHSFPAEFPVAHCREVSAVLAYRSDSRRFDEAVEMNHRFLVPVIVATYGEVACSIDLLVLEHVGDYPRLPVEAYAQLSDAPRIPRILLGVCWLHITLLAGLDRLSLPGPNRILELLRIRTTPNPRDVAASDVREDRFLDHDLAVVGHYRSVPDDCSVHPSELGRDVHFAGWKVPTFARLSEISSIFLRLSPSHPDSTIGASGSGHLDALGTRHRLTHANAIPAHLSVVDRDRPREHFYCHARRPKRPHLLLFVEEIEDVIVPSFPSVAVLHSVPILSQPVLAHRDYDVRTRFHGLDTLSLQGIELSFFPLEHQHRNGSVLHDNIIESFSNLPRIPAGIRYHEHALAFPHRKNVVHHSARSTNERFVIRTLECVHGSTVGGLIHIASFQGLRHAMIVCLRGRGAR